MFRASLLLIALSGAASAEAWRPCASADMPWTRCGAAFPPERPLRFPTGEVPALPTDRLLEPPDLDASRVVELEPLRRMRPRGDSVIPPIVMEPPGRDPRAVQRFQAPYRLD